MTMGGMGCQVCFDTPCTCATDYEAKAEKVHRDAFCRPVSEARSIIASALRDAADERQRELLGHAIICPECGHRYDHAVVVQRHSSGCDETVVGPQHAIERGDFGGVKMTSNG